MMNLAVISRCLRQPVAIVKRSQLVFARHCSNTTSDNTKLDDARSMLSGLGSGSVKLQKDYSPGIALITVDNTERKNSLSGRMMTHFEDIVEDLNNWEEGKGLILQAAGNEIFCSGGETQTLREISTPECGLLMSHFMHHVLTRFYTLPLVSVAVVHGRALGGGAELTTITDFRLFSPKGSIGFVHGQKNLVTGWGGGTRLTQLVGPRKALDLMTTGRFVGCDEAIKLGLADGTVSEESRLKEALEWMKLRTAFQPQVIRGMKKITSGSRDALLQESLENEFNIFTKKWGTPENAETIGKRVKIS